MTDITGTPVLHLQYLPFGEPWVSQTSNSYEGAKYTFSGKERDKETGLMYFGARYYNPEYGIWNQVDPLHAKYPGLSPFVYCANRPTILTDPDGRWIPGLDDDGKVVYKAEKGDTHDSFVKQFHTGGKSQEIFANSKLSTTGEIKEGSIITGAAVQKATGSEVLKGSWGNMTNTQKVAQLIFAVNHSVIQGKSEFDFNDYAYGFESYKGENFSNTRFPSKDGNITIRNVSIWFTDNNSKSYNYPQYKQSYGDLIGKYDFRFPKPGSFRSMILFSLDPKYDESFGKLFK
jgi:RHS repeat-associated protein